MKLTFAKEDLARAAAITQSMVNAQTSLPVLANILVEAEGERAVFVATDLESSVRCAASARIEETGRVTIPARTFAELVRELPEGEVSMSIENDHLVAIQAGDNQYHLQTMPAEDFPSWPELKPDATLTVEQKELEAMLGRVLFAIPPRDPRKVLLGALFDVKDGALNMVATDGKKLGFCRRSLDEMIGAEETSAIVPQKILHEVQRALGEEGDVKVLIAERQVAFDLGDTVFMANKIDGVYPNYDMVIPKPEDIQKSAKFDRDQMAAGVRRAAIISEEKNNSIIMRLEPERARISAKTYDVGDYEGHVPIAYEGEPYKLAFNHKFMQEVLRIMDDADVTLRIKSNASPVIFVNESDEDSLYLIMPIKMSDLADLGDGAEE